MCGIVGFAGMQDHALLAAMNDEQRHRGPDDAGVYHDDRLQVSLAMRRLSIQDIEGGHQPMANADRSLWIVFNGEIMNAPALRRELEASGHRFVTNHSDTEVLLHLYERDGERMLERLNGMFAFVLYDRRRGVLFGARDQFGIKPLYYTLDRGRFIFASELKSVQLAPGVSGALSSQALSHYLSFQCIPAPHTIYRDIHKLPAAHSFTYALERRELRTERYWWASPGVQPAHSSLAADELRRLVRSELEGAVDRWMLSDVPVACSLSGGIDSSVIAAIMATRSATPIATYSLGFEDAPELDERPLARLVSERWKTDHREIVLRSDQLLDDLPLMVDSLDEPYAGGLPSWFVFKRMAGEVKVCMTGTGGDEIFGNYGKWRPYESPWRRLRATAGLARRLGSLRPMMRHPRGALYSLYFREAEKVELLVPQWQQACTSSELLVEQLWSEANPATARDAVRLIDLQVQLPDEFLHMTDRFSMAHSIEARPPFLDRTFAEQLMAVPAHERVGVRRLKQVLLDAVQDLLPPELLAAPKKGFVLPVARWLRGRLRSQVEHFLGERHIDAQGIFRADAVTKLREAHLSGREDRSWQIWTLLMFQLWQEQAGAG